MNELNLGEVLEDFGKGSTQALCIEASAGTGKTWTLERLVLGLILKAGIELPEILVLTYTEAATQELKERIRGRLEDLVAGNDEGRDLSELLGIVGESGVQDRLRGALASFDQSSIHTIHGFCLGILRDYPLELGMVKVAADMEAATNRKTRIISDTLLAMLYGDKSTDIDRAGADLLLSEFTGRVYDDPMAELAKKVGQWFDAGYGDKELYGVDLAAWSQASLWLAIDGTGAGLRQEARELALAGRQILDSLGIGDSLVISREGLKNIQVSFTGAVGAISSFRALVQWCEAPGPFHRWIVAAPAPIHFRKLALKGIDAILKNLPESSTLASGIAASFSQNWASFCSEFEAFEAELSHALAYQSMVADVLEGRTEDSVQWLFASIPAIGFFYRAAGRIGDQIASLRQSEGLVDFSGMIDLVYQGLSKPGSPLQKSLSKRWNALLVDEFQDTDSKQWSIFQGLFSNKPLVLVGDPKQAIYAFRGADIGVYQGVMGTLEAEKPGTIRLLATNHRSSRSLVEGCNFLFSHLRRAELFPPFVPIKYSAARQETLAEKFAGSSLHTGASHLVALPEKRALRAWAQWILAELRRLFAQGLSPADITVLCSKNRDGAYLQRFFMGEGVPARLRGRGSLSSSQQADSLLHLCNAMAQGASLPQLKAFGLSLLGGSSLETLAADLDSRLGVLIHRAVDSYINHGFIPALDLVLADREHEIARHPEGRRMLTDLYQLGELFDRKVRSSSTSVERLGFAMADFLSQLRSEEEHSLELDRQDPAVSIMTMHASKGLEFPVVFLVPNLGGKTAVRRYPASFKRDGHRTLGFCAHPADLGLMDENDQQNAMTLYYVALTRASWRQYLPLLDRSRPKGKTVKEKATLANLPPTYLGDPGDVDVWFSALLDMIELTRAGVYQLSPDDKEVFSLHFIRRSWAEVYESAPGEVSTETRPPRLEVLANPGPESIGSTLCQRPPRSRFPRQSSYSRLAEKVLERSPRNSHSSLGIEPVATSKLPAGKDFGLLIHEIFEKWDFAELYNQCSRLVGAPSTGPDPFIGTLTKFAKVWGFKAREFSLWADELVALLLQTLEHKLALGGGLLCVKDLKPQFVRKECNFTLGITANNPRLSNPQVLSALGLADPIAVPRGFLTGSIDLLFVHGQEVHVLDWKTNRLPDYSLGSLEAAMDSHLYKLQALLYLASARARFPGAPIGKAHYLFVRGPGLYEYSVGEDILDLIIADLKGSTHGSV